MDLHRSFSLPKDQNNTPLNTSIAVSTGPIAALSGGIEVSVDIRKKVKPPTSRLSGNQVFKAAEDLINCFLCYSHYLPIYCLHLEC